MRKYDHCIIRLESMATHSETETETETGTLMSKMVNARVHQGPLMPKQTRFKR